MAARRLLSTASASGKGGAFNGVKEYLQDCIRHIESQGKRASVEFLAIRVDLIIRWRIQGFKDLDWNLLTQDLKSLLETSKYRDDVIKLFYHAVSLFQTGCITEANAGFASLRRLQLASGSRDIRCYYLGKTGHAQRLQGDIRAQARVRIR